MKGGRASALEDGAGGTEKTGAGVVGKAVWLGGRNDWPSARLITGQPAGSHRVKLRARWRAAGVSGLGEGAARRRGGRVWRVGGELYRRRGGRQTWAAEGPHLHLSASAHLLL